MKLRGDNGMFLTQELFYEFGNKEAPYTLRPYEHKARNGKTYPSVYDIYMSCADEYEAAMKIVQSLHHWRKLCALDWFMNGPTVGDSKFPGLNQWREDMALRDASESKRQLLEEAENGNITAMKYINEQANKSKKPVGRTQKSKPKSNSTVTELQERFKGVKK